MTNEQQQETCGCPKIIPTLRTIRLPTLPLSLSPVKEMGWWCNCGKVYLPLSRVKFDCTSTASEETK